MSGDHQSLIGAFAGALCCVAAFDCNLAFDKYGGILLWIGLMLYMFKALGTICDEYFVPSLEVIVDKLQLSNDVAGATFMAAGSSAPELFTSLVATFLIVNEGGVGTIVGSAIFNILVIVGATGVIACKDQETGEPKPLKIWWYPLSRDCFFYSLSITELMVVISDEEVMWYEALIMFLTYILYCVYMKFNPAIVKMLGLIDPSSVDPVEAVEDSAAPMVQVVEVTPTAATAAAANGSALKETSEADQSTKQPEVNVPAKEEAKPATTDVVKIGVSEPLATVTVSPAADKDAVEPLKDQPGENQLSVAKPAGLGSANSLMAPQQSPREVRRPSWSYAQTNGGTAQEKSAKDEERKPSKEGEVTVTEKDAAPAAEPQEEEDGPKGLFGTSFLRDPLLVFWELTMPSPETAGGGLLFSLSILFIGLCTYLMVDSTSRVGVIVHIPPLAMALVFLAAGTSIPDALGSIAVAKQGEGDMAVCNALGSNVFDILVGLGIPWLIKTGIMGKQVTFVGKWDELIYDIFVLIIVLFLFIGSLLINRWYLTRRVGFILLGFYLVFILYNVLAVWVIDPPLKTQAPEDGTCVTI